MRFLVLALPEELRLHVRAFRHAIFRQSGDPSACWGPDAVFLAKTTLLHLPQEIPFPEGEVRLQAAVATDKGLVIPVTGVERLCSFLHGKEQPFIFLASDARQTEGAPQGIIDDFRIELIDFTKTEDLAVWSTLESVHLWRGKGRKEDRLRT